MNATCASPTTRSLIMPAARSRWEYAASRRRPGYVGDTPAIVSTFRILPDRGGTDIRIVATLGTSQQQCNIFLVRNEAPQFKNGKEAVQWMAGKDISSPHGSCMDRFARLAFKQAGI
jgi:NitT/TauT family transport system substrate-binding protein